MDEMRSLIGQRHGLRSIRPLSVVDPPMPSSSSVASSSSSNSFEPSEVQGWLKSANEFINNAENDINRAAESCSKLEDELQLFVQIYKEVCLDPFYEFLLRPIH